ncbi:MAG: PEP-CTERM sorting domain-containing protein [Tepidisphaeraceae bacterium]|jgi:hypothetical protein
MRWKLAVLAASVVGVGVGAAANAAIATGAEFSGALLSVDINGGPLAGSLAPTEGSYNAANNPTVQNTVVPDALGNTWSPWGGNTYDAGDGIQLPSSQSSPNVFASSIAKTFTDGITATISEAGSAANYAQGGGGATFNSRDRGTPAADPNPSTTLGYMFRDLLFAGGSGSNIQSTNFMQLTLTGLTPGSSYALDVWSDDPTGTHSMNWTATPPTNNPSNRGPGKIGWDPDPTDVFTAPPDEQTISWTSGSSLPLPAAQFTLTADTNGSLTVYGWGGNGVTGSQSADTSYINGFQLVAVPEPASLGLIGVASLGLMFRRRKA